jgi:HSP20 family protein
MIRAEVRAEREEHKGEMLRQERITGVFQRAFTLPTEIDPNRVEARMDNGILVVSLPKAESTKPKRVDIQGKSQRAQGNGGNGGNGQGNGKASGSTQQKTEASSTQEKNAATGSR